MLFQENTALNLKGVLKQITFNYSFTLGQKKSILSVFLTTQRLLVNCVEFNLKDSK